MQITQYLRQDQDAIRDQYAGLANSPLLLSVEEEMAKPAAVAGAVTVVLRTAGSTPRVKCLENRTPQVSMKKRNAWCIRPQASSVSPLRRARVCIGS